MPNLDLAKSFERIKLMVTNKASVPVGMQDLICWCAERHPHKDWQRLAAIRWDEDLCRLAVWLDFVLRDQPPQRTITGLWFGLFNPVVEEGAAADLYVAGNPYDADGEWAVSPRWVAPAARSIALAEMYRIAYENKKGLGNDAEYPLALGYAALAVRTLGTALNRRVLLGKAPSRTLEVGFDSGDSMVVGTLSA